MTRGLLVAAPRSGSGKTTVTLAILAALRRRGLSLRAAKSGPDYIDPGFHAACLGTPCLNLDSWAMPPALLASLAGGSPQHAPGEAPEDALLLVEASMGLFDGVEAADGGGGRAADLAARFALPVLLVLVEAVHPSQPWWGLRGWMLTGVAWLAPLSAAQYALIVTRTVSAETPAIPAATIPPEAVAISADSTVLPLRDEQGAV